MTGMIQLAAMATFSILLSGCLGAKDSSAPSSAASPVDASVTFVNSLSKDTECNNGKKGGLVYDKEQSQFFACDGDQWIALNLKGSQGDKGEVGSQGPAGPVGATGAQGRAGDQGPTGAQGPQGPQGPIGLRGPAGADGATGAQGPRGEKGAMGATGAPGRDGRDGIDGNGVGIALRENGQVRGLLIQFDWTYDREQTALMMLPSHDFVYANLNTGAYTGRPAAVYYSELGCTGTAFVSNSISYSPGPHFPSRIYVGNNNAGQPAAFYRAEELIVENKVTKSRRSYTTYGQMNTCQNGTDTIYAGYLRVIEIPALDSLTHLAPLKFAP